MMYAPGGAVRGIATSAKAEHESNADVFATGIT
jgi:hypothetical protein